MKLYREAEVWLLIAGAEEMHMIGHHHELADHPAVSLGSRFELARKMPRADGSPAVDAAGHANRQKIDGRFDPNRVETAKMLVASQGTESITDTLSIAPSPLYTVHAIAALM